MADLMTARACPTRPPRSTRSRPGGPLAERLLDDPGAAAAAVDAAPSASRSTAGSSRAARARRILEVCRDNGIEIPTLCYEPKLPGFGACRMCVVEVEGEEHPPISCSRAAEPGMVVQTQTAGLRQLRKTNLELIFSDHNAYCLPPCQNKCPSHIDIPGFLKANTEGDFAESARIFKRTIPFPSRPRPRLPGARARSTAGATRSTRPSPSATATATPATRSSRRCRRRHRAAGAVRGPGRRPASGPRSSAPGRPAWPRPTTSLIAGHEVTVFERDPAPGGMLRYGIPQYRLPKVEVLEAEYQSVTHLGGKIVCNAGLGRDFTLDDLPEPGLRRGRRGHRLLRHEQAGHPRRGRRRRARRPRVPAHRHARPALSRPRRQARRGHRRRLHLDGLHRAPRSARAPRR